MKMLIRVLEEVAQGERQLHCALPSERLKRKVPVLLCLANSLEAYSDTQSNPAKLAPYQLMSREATVALLALGLLGLRAYNGPSIMDPLESAERLSNELLRNLEEMTGERF